MSSVLILNTTHQNELHLLPCITSCYLISLVLSVDICIAPKTADIFILPPIIDGYIACNSLYSVIECGRLSFFYYFTIYAILHLILVESIVKTIPTQYTILHYSWTQQASPQCVCRDEKGKRRKKAEMKGWKNREGIIDG